VCEQNANYEHSDGGDGSARLPIIGSRASGTLYEIRAVPNHSEPRRVPLRMGRPGARAGVIADAALAPEVTMTSPGRLNGDRHADQLPMMAAIAESSGEPIRVSSIDRPEAGAGQVLVRIHASGVNPLDTKIYAGEAPHARHPLPAILGLDLAGVVDAVGSSVERFRPGDEVYGTTGDVGGHPGTLAQFAA